MTADVTKYLLTMCYHCEEAHNCETEEKCRTCWAEKALQQHEQAARQELTTEQLLREYAL